MTYSSIQLKEAYTTEAEGEYLYNRALEMDSVVEIGCFTGKSTHALLSACKGLVHAVDHFQGTRDSTDATFEKSGEDVFMKTVGHFPNLRIWKMPSLEAVKHFEDKSIDMIFIDGSHVYEEVLADIINWRPKIKRFMCGHDISDPRVIRAVDKSGLRWQIAMSSMWEVWL